MTPREDILDRLLGDLAFCAGNATGQPRSAAARSELRRACDRVGAFRKREKAEADFAAAAPWATDPRATDPRAADPRPEPPPLESPPLQSPALGLTVVAGPVPNVRLPYKED